MTKVTRRTMLAGPAIAPFADGVLADATRRSVDDAETARDKIRARYFPNLLLKTHEGKQVRFYDDLIKGKVVTINMMFTSCPGVCPGITANLLKVQKLLGSRVGKDLFMYSLTLDPENDTPKVLGEYVKKHRIGPGWTLLTGDKKDLETLRRRLGFTNPNPQVDADIEQHIGNVRYGNEPRMLWAACPGLAKPEWIVQSLSWVIRGE